MAYIGRPLNAGNLAVQSGTGDGSDTTPIATLNHSVGSSNSVAVYLDGVRQLAGTDYTAVGTTLTFTTAPANGVGVDVYFLGLELSIPTPADATVAKAKITTTLINEHVDTTITASDSLLFSDATDSNANKKDTVQGILDLVPAHTGNVAFPATQVASADANTLDDYEETTWTCTLTDGSNDATGTATGTATKVGRLVVASAYLQTSSLGSVSGSIQMKGLPYTSANDGKYHSCAIGYGQGWAYTAGYMVSVHLPPNSTTMDMYVFDTAAGATGFQSGEWSDNGQMMITVSYTSA